MEDVVKVIGKGRSGWHAAGISQWGTFSTSSYNVGEDQLEKFAAKAEDGALVYDASESGHEFEVVVLRGPLIDVKLPPDGVRRFSEADRAAALRMAPALQGAFKTYALAAQQESFTGLDRVGTGVYEAILRSVPGVKIGHVSGGKVVWEAP